MTTKKYLSVLATLLLSPFLWAGEASPWGISFSDATGLSLQYRGVPIVHKSTLHVVTPGWRSHLYGQNYVKESINEKQVGGRTVLEVHGENSAARVRYQVREISDRQVEIQFRCKILERTERAHVEYAIGYVNANLFANRPYRANTLEGVVTGKIPAMPSSGDPVANAIAPGFRDVTLDSRIGTIRFQVSQTDDLHFFDARRRSMDWAKERPVFWFGLQRDVDQDETVDLTVNITVDPEELPSRANRIVKPTVHFASDALSPDDGGMQLIPRPQHLTVVDDDATFPLASDTQWHIQQPPDEKRLAPALRSFLEKWDMPESTIQVTATDSDDVTIITAGNTDTPLPLGATIEGAQWRQHDEGYRLEVSSTGLTIIGSTPRGAFYGLQTLAQLRRATSNELASVVIEDWPALSFRGLHWYPSEPGVDLNRKTIELMARLKLNHAVIQAESARWTSFPELAVPQSIKKEHLVELVKLCRANFIEPIPLIATPGHMEWAFRHGANRTIVEDPQVPFAYNVKDPRSYAFIQTLLQEVIDVFEPKMIHLGHDEVGRRGRFPNPTRGEYSGETLSELVVLHATRMHAWLEERGIRMMLWSDMFLHDDEVGRSGAANAPSLVEAQQMRQSLPKDVVFTDWHYQPVENYPSINVFQNAGFDTIVCPWREPENIYHFAHEAVAQNAMGLLQPTWVYFPSEAVLATETAQYAGYVLAAEYAWSDRPEPPDELPYRADEVFFAHYREGQQESAEGQLVNLDEVATASRVDWLDLGPGWDLAVAGDPQRFGGVQFDLPEDGVVVLGGEMAPTGAAASLTLELNTKTQTIALLHGAGWDDRRGTDVGRMVVTYADGSTVTETFQLADDVVAWTSTLPARNARTGWTAQGPVDTALGLRVTQWDNPHPNRVLASVRFELVNPGQAWVLAGITLIN